MLFDYLLRTKTKGARCTALELHQSFKWGFIATQNKELCVPGKRIEEWLKGATVLSNLTKTGLQWTDYGLDKLKSLARET
jgi:hypothetical protein